MSYPSLSGQHVRQSDVESPGVDDNAMHPWVGHADCDDAELDAGSTGALAEVDAPRHGGRARVDPGEDRRGRRHDPHATQADLEARDARGSGEARPRGYL